MSQDRAYPLALRVLHWGTAGLITGQVALIWLGAQVRPTGHAVAPWAVPLHISIGVLIFALTVYRFGLRRRHHVPLPSSLGPTQARWARLSHRLLYAFLLALPVTGYVKLASLGAPVTIFGFVSLPALPFSVPAARAAQLMHTGAAWSLFAVLVMHIGAALLHRHLHGNPVLPRMGIGRG